MSVNGMWRQQGSVLVQKGYLLATDTSYAYVKNLSTNAVHTASASSMGGYPQPMGIYGGYSWWRNVGDVAKDVYRIPLGSTAYEKYGTLGVPGTFNLLSGFPTFRSCAIIGDYIYSPGLEYRLPISVLDTPPDNPEWESTWVQALGKIPAPSDWYPYVEGRHWYYMGHTRNYMIKLNIDTGEFEKIDFNDVTFSTAANAMWKIEDTYLIKANNNNVYRYSKDLVNWKTITTKVLGNLSLIFQNSMRPVIDPGKYYVTPITYVKNILMTEDPKVFVTGNNYDMYGGTFVAAGGTTVYHNQNYTEREIALAKVKIEAIVATSAPGAQAGYNIGGVAPVLGFTGYAAPIPWTLTKNNLRLYFTTALQVPHATTGAITAMTVANWMFRITITVPRESILKQYQDFIGS
jgi:hypothetical protein